MRIINTLTEFQDLLELSNTKLVVINFSVVWCGPCRYIDPIYELMAEEYTQVEFCKVDVDESLEVAEHLRISAMPTFKFLKGREVVGQEVMGADEVQLRSCIEELI